MIQHLSASTNTTMIKRILLIALGLFLVAQLIQPDRSVPAIDPAKDMLALTNAPPDIRELVIGAWYDCHSYQTTYPWYGKLTPMNFIMQDHIDEGRKVLNFSVWDQYTNSEAAGESGEEIVEGEMAPGYYKLMHGHGDLDAARQKELVAWFNGLPGGEGGGSGEGMGEKEAEGE